MGAYISSITEASWSREGEHRAKVRYAAECLISPTPAWLTKVLSDFAFEISTQHNIEHMSLTRKDLFEAVSSAQRMAIGFIEFLQTPHGPGFVAAHAPEIDEDFRLHLIEPLQKIARSMNSVPASMLDARGKIRSGRGKALLPGSMPARYICAAIISEAVRFLEQKGLSAPTKAKLNQSATHLWTSLLPPLKGWGESRSPSWTRYFKAAEDPRLATLRQEVFRHLSIEMDQASWRE
jgi:hypothetical protein